MTNRMYLILDQKSQMFQKTFASSCDLLEVAFEAIDSAIVRIADDPIPLRVKVAE